VFSFGQTYPLKKSVEGDIDFFLPYKREREREREREFEFMLGLVMGEPSKAIISYFLFML